LLLVVLGLGANQTLNCNNAQATTNASPQQIVGDVKSNLAAREFVIGGDPDRPKSAPAQGTSSSPTWTYALSPASGVTWRNPTIAKNGTGIGGTITASISGAALTVRASGNLASSGNIVAPTWSVTADCGTFKGLVNITSRANAAYTVSHSLLGSITCNATGTLTIWAVVSC